METVTTGRQSGSSRRDSGFSRRQSGFSMVEVLIAAAILLLVVLGLVPLFHRSMIYSASGREATAITNQSLSSVESFYELPLDNRDLDLAAAGVDQIETLEYWNDETKSWEVEETTATLTSIPKRTRTTRIRQYSLNAMADGELAPTESLAGGVNPREIHFKETEILLVSEGTDGLGGRIQLRRLKAY